MITVAGLSGVCISETVKAEAKRADKVFCRTFLTPAGKAVKAELAGAESMDDLFSHSLNFDELNERIAERLLNAGNALYCVDGDCLLDSAAQLLQQKTSVKFIRQEQVCAGRAASDVAVISAYDISSYMPDTFAALKVYGIDDGLLASEVKLKLMQFYQPDTAVYFYRGGKESKILLEELDRGGKYDYSCALFIDGDRGVEKKRYCFADLIRILSRLTGENGCPWDRAQTHESIRINLLEEAYEAVDAIDKGDAENLAEELGDVLLQAVFHCDMAERGGEFDLGDVVSGLCTKLVGRHTHIFGQDRATDSESALKFWEQAKAVEKNYSTLPEQLKRLPDSFPALLSAQKTIKKINKAGATSFVPEDELNGITEAADRLQRDGEKAAGELLLRAVKLISGYGIDCETALNAAAAELRRRHGA